MARTTTIKPQAKVPAKNAAPPRRRASHGGMRGTVVTFAVVGLATLAATALPLCVLLVAGMLPTLAAAIVDHHRARYLARTVGAMNFAGLLPSGLHMWYAGTTFASLHGMIGSPFVWLQMYGAAAVGWLLYLGAPPVARVVLDLHADDVRHKLEIRAKTLIEEWGQEASGRKREGDG